MKVFIVYDLQHSNMKLPFAIYLSRMLETRGAAANLSRDSGVIASQISRIAEGSIIPERDTFNKLVSAMSQEDRNAMGVEYLKYYCPDFTDIQIRVENGAESKDRLTQACAKLDLGTREALATILEGVNRAPEMGTSWLRSMAALFQPSESKFSSQADKDLVDYEPCSVLKPAPHADSTSTAPTKTPLPSLDASTAPPRTAPSPSGTTTHLPPHHWNEDTQGPPVTEKREAVTYPPAKRRKSR